MLNQNSDPIDFFKEAAQHLRGTLKDKYQIEVGSSHAHAAVAGALGHGSKIALITSEGIDAEDPFLARRNTLDVENTAKVISHMKDTPLKKVSASIVVRMIADGLTPGCACCTEKTTRSFILGYRDGEDYPDEPEFICPECASDEDEFGQCTYCRDGVLYRLSQLNRNGECEEHAGESSLSSEEEEDMDSYIEYHTKDGGID